MIIKLLELMFVLKYDNINVSNLLTLEIVGRGSETQFQVNTNSSKKLA